ncbi:hypothetical protein BD413DRAFT_559616 [Trametes elegans]|nr:hypothetical protein BD413DRAFT_559616 [Trametes elegans]
MTSDLPTTSSNDIAVERECIFAGEDCPHITGATDATTSGIPTLRPAYGLESDLCVAFGPPPVIFESLTDSHSLADNERRGVLPSRSSSSDASARSGFSFASSSSLPAECLSPHDPIFPAFPSLSMVTRTPSPSVHQPATTPPASTRKLRARVAQVAGIPKPPEPQPQRCDDGKWFIRCPLCDLVQHNNRVQDMKRHIDAHFRQAMGRHFQCVGVPVEEVDQEIFGRLRGPLAKIREYDGRMYVGGCGQKFGRKSSLQRHLNVKGKALRHGTRPEGGQCPENGKLLRCLGSVRSPYDIEHVPE